MEIVKPIFNDCTEQCCIPLIQTFALPENCSLMTVPHPPNPEHTSALHKHRLGRNVAVGAALLVLVVVLFALTLVKLSRQAGESSGFNHTPPSIPTLSTLL